jgi:hypothetical protein
MYAIYKQKKYDADIELDNTVTIYSYVKEEGFENDITPWGEVEDDYFSKKVNMNELDYLYRTVYEIQYKGHFFDVMSTMKRINIDEDWFAIRAGIEKYELIEKLGFKVYDKATWWKDIRRKDIEAIKIIEEPEGIFKDQGSKVKILEGEAIDEFLASVKD